jgi:hypothetical protein
MEVYLIFAVTPMRLHSPQNRAILSGNPTRAQLNRIARAALQLVKNHTFLLVGRTEKPLLHVQEKS